MPVILPDQFCSKAAAMEAAALPAPMTKADPDLSSGRKSARVELGCAAFTAVVNRLMSSDLWLSSDVKVQKRDSIANAVVGHMFQCFN